MRVGTTQATTVDPLSGKTVTVDVPVYASGFWIVITVTSGSSDALYAIPYCMREADRDKALVGKPYVLRERFTSEQLAVPYSISPQWAGVDYSNSGAR